jgi:hypothetical protein
VRIVSGLVDPVAVLIRGELAIGADQQTMPGG